jgi:two-component system cell cycle response regulator
MHIVVVDPSRVVLKIIAHLLAEEGAVSGFVDSDAALRLIQSDPTVEVLITSLEVQPVNGMELCWEARQARTADRFLYVMVMSSLRDEQMLAEALDCGADDLIAKPLKGIELQARIRLIRRLKAKQLELVRLSETDPLSGLLNRRAFFVGATKLFERRHGGDQLCAIMLDIDHFKRINDHYGHPTGDVVIKAIADAANKVGGIVGRLGGEEFAIILDGYDGQRAYELADALRQSCADLKFTGDSGETFSVTCSFGVSHAEEGDTRDDMLKNADIALYQAKNSGRNCVKRAAGGDGALLELPSENIRSRQR